MSIRRATPDDARAIAELQVETWRHAYAAIMPEAVLAQLSVDDRETLWRGWIGSKDKSTWLIESASQLEGFSSIGPSRDRDAPPGCAELYAIYLRPSAHGRGVGRQLFDHAVLTLRTQGYREMTLWVLTKNERARRFYERQGMRLEGATQLEVFGTTPLQEVRYLLRL